MSEHKAALQALCAAFYCLHDVLAAKGALEAGEIAEHLRRVGPAPGGQAIDQAFWGALNGIIHNLDERQFQPRDRPDLVAIDGGLIR